MKFFRARQEDSISRQKLMRALFGVAAILIVLDLLVDIHAKAPGENLFGFYPLVGLIATVLIVRTANWLGDRFRQPLPRLEGSDPDSQRPRRNGRDSESESTS